jgi:hypothetical protein
MEIQEGIPVKTKKLRELTVDEQWVLRTVKSAPAKIPYWKLCVAWAREMGTNGNVVA